MNQEPVPIEMERDGKDVYIKMTSQITDIEITDGLTYKAWTFNGEAPGPLVVVEEGIYPFVTHQFNYATKGAVGFIEVTK